MNIYIFIYKLPSKDVYLFRSGQFLLVQADWREGVLTTDPCSTYTALTDRNNFGFKLETL